jgi:hypothetical protein
VLRLARSLVAAAVEAAGRAEDFPARRDVGRDHTVTAPEPLRLVQMLDDRDLAEEVVDEADGRRADVPGDPAHTVIRRCRIRRRRQML